MEKPETANSQELIINIQGPVIQGENHSVTYESYNLSVVKDYNLYYLLVRHGGGQEKIRLSTAIKTMLGALQKMTDVEAFSVLFSIYDAHKRSARESADKTARHWLKAATENRIKRRKVRNQNRIKVWIMDEVQHA